MFRASVAAAFVLLTLCQPSVPCEVHLQPGDAASATVFCVDMDGCCNFTTVQAAVDAAPENSLKRSVTVKANKTITFQGQGMNTTMIVWNDTKKSAKTTSGSASVYIYADGFVAKNISFKNSAPAAKPGAVDAQAVALGIEGDKAAFWGCGFYSGQDTLLDKSKRHYFKDCFIEGSIDFIFGDGRSLYENCILNSIAEEGHGSITGAITAQSRKSAEENTGFAFVGCSIQGTGSILLGRAWQPYSRVVFTNTEMQAIVAAQGWGNWGDNTRNSKVAVFYGEFNCFGDGANMAGRVAYARKLDELQARPFLNSSYINGGEWLKPFDNALTWLHTDYQSTAAMEPLGIVLIISAEALKGEEQRAQVAGNSISSSGAGSDQAFKVDGFD
ncbi:hypothetical protein U9M48_021788 [Paspalum notatum var. saurae]|uniref:Pectinesterase n=1 Tax=Paspalum notatum var. saurae TaxID=547442 RepID=A0AAQ3TIG1_PASNO